MAAKKEIADNSFAKINRVKPLTNVLLSIVLTIIAIVTVLPVVLVVMISLSTSESLTYNGFSFFPSELTLTAYENLFKSGSQIVDSYIVTIAMTLCSAALGLFIMAMFAYVLSNPRFAARKFYTFLLFVTMVFSGGLVPGYIINVSYLHLYDTFWILVLSSMVNQFYIIVLRTFISTTIPLEMMDAAQIDGADELRIFTSIVLPLAKAGLATVALFLIVNKWNDWFVGMLYIENAKLVPLQTMLTRIQQKIDFVKNNSSIAGTPEGVALLRSMPTEQTRMAIVVVSTVPILFAYPFFQRFFIQGLTVGSVKG